MDECKPLVLGWAGVPFKDAKDGVAHYAQKLHGRAVQLDSLKIRVERAYPWVQRLKLQYDGPLSNVALKFNLRRYSTVRRRVS